MSEVSLGHATTYGLQPSKECHDGFTLLRSGRAEIDVTLQVSIRESGDVIILDLKGKATIGVDSDLLRCHLKELVAHGARNLLLNLEGLTQVDSSGVSTIVEAYHSLRGQGGNLKFLRPNGRVLVVLRVTHLLNIIPSFDDETEALSSFRPRSYSATP